MAKTTNLGDKYTHRVTLRLTDDQFNWLIEVSKILGVTPSEYMRMSVNSGMVIMKQVEEQHEGEVGTNENVKTNSDDIV